MSLYNFNKCTVQYSIYVTHVILHLDGTMTFWKIAWLVLTECINFRKHTLSAMLNTKYFHTTKCESPALKPGLVHAPAMRGSGFIMPRFRLLSGQCGILVTSIVFWDSVEVGDTIWFFKTHPHLSLHVKLICKSLKMSDHKKYLRIFVHWIEMDFLHKWKSIISF